MSNLAKAKKLAEMLLPIIDSVADKVSDLAELRQRLAERVKAGDLDDSLKLWVDADARAEDFINRGT